MFSGALFISKYLLFIGYIQNTLTVNFHTIFIVVRKSSAPVSNDHRGVTEETMARYDQDGKMLTLELPIVNIKLFLLKPVKMTGL